MTDDQIEEAFERAGGQRAFSPKFGDTLRGIWAGDRNPQRDGFYVRTVRVTGKLNPGKWYELTDGKGEFWKYEAKATVLIRDAAPVPAVALRQAAKEAWVAMCQHMPNHKATHDFYAAITSDACDTAAAPAPPVVPMGENGPSRLWGVQDVSNYPRAAAAELNRLIVQSEKSAAAQPVSLAVAGGRKDVAFPALPKSGHRHPVLGDLWDRMDMHQYALRYADEVRALSAAPASPASPVPLGYIDRKDIARLSNYKATIWPGENEIEAVPVYLAPGAPVASPVGMTDGQVSRRATARFHGAWCAAKNLPDYDKKAWIYVQQHFDNAIAAAPGSASPVPDKDAQANGLAWAVSRWKDEVSQRPLVNVHRRTLDDTWRQVIRYFGGDPVKLIGPPHDELWALGQTMPASPVQPAISSPEIPDNCFDTASPVPAENFYPDGLMFDGLGNPRQRYVRIVHDGSSCVCTPSEVDEIVATEIAGEGTVGYQQIDVYLSEAEFEALPEFEGF